MRFNQFLIRLITFAWAIAFCFPTSAEKSPDVVLKEPPLRVSNSKAWKPYSYLDSNGEPQGILVDFWREYAKRSGREVQFVLTDWADSIELVKNGQADVHAGLMWSDEREQLLDYGVGFFSIDAQLFFSKALLGVDVARFVLGKEGGKIGVVKGGYEEYYAREHFPNVPLVLFDNNQILLDSVLNHQVKAFIADFYVANFYLNTTEDHTAFAPVKELYSETIYYAVAEGNQALLAPLNQVFKQIDQKDKDAILSRWMYIETVYPPFLFPGLVVFVCLVVLFYIRTLKRTVKARTYQLEQANIRLEQLAKTDPLTGISNRRHFMELLSAPALASSSISILVFDIDNFKLVNDNFGHEVGDQVIREVVIRVKSQLSSESLFARVGGEEFAVVVGGLTEEQLNDLAERLCDSVYHTPMNCLPSEDRASISVGGAYYQGGNDSLTLSDADHLMYQAKKAGKNQAKVQAFS